MHKSWEFIKVGDSVRVEDRTELSVVDKGTYKVVRINNRRNGDLKIILENDQYNFTIPMYLKEANTCIKEQGYTYRRWILKD